MDIKEKITSARERLNERQKALVKDIEEIDINLAEFRAYKRKKRMEIVSLIKQSKKMDEKGSSEPMTHSIIEELQKEKTEGISIDDIRGVYKKLGINASIFSVKNQVSGLVLDGEVCSSSKDRGTRLYKTTTKQPETTD